MRNCTTKAIIMQDKSIHLPLTIFNNWLEEAKSICPEPTAMSVATVNKEGKPSQRQVLLKKHDKHGFVFFTNLNSRKSIEIRNNPYVSLCFFWPELSKQIRIEGKAEQVPDDEADSYFKTRLRESQLGAWASAQSDTLSSRDLLIDKYNEFALKFKNQEIPRPPFWSGYLVVPERIEFWKGHRHRLNEREVYEKNEKQEWITYLLFP